MPEPSLSPSANTNRAIDSASDPAWAQRRSSASDPPPVRMAVRMSWRGDLVTAVLGTWLVGGAFLDGWAHNTRPRLETFFTPWHAVLYSGYAASAVWLCWSMWSPRRWRQLAGGAGLSGGAGGWRNWRYSIPAGYAPALAGAGLFLISGLGDLSWHLAFGVEHDIAALLSPTHLGLFVGGLLMVTAPLRSALADPTLTRGLGCRTRLGRLLPAVLSASLAGCATAFMFQYLHPAWADLVGRDRGLFLRQTFQAGQYHFVYDQNVTVGAAGFVLATVFLFGPLLMLLRRWQPPAGSAMLVLAVQFIAVQGLTGFADAGLVLVGVVGAVVVEVLLAVLRPRPSSGRRLSLLCALAPAAFWGVYVGGIAAFDHGLGWPAELWGGAIVWSGLTLLVLALLAVPPHAPLQAQATAHGVGALAAGQQQVGGLR
jgi:hypothetical protein